MKALLTTGTRWRIPGSRPGFARALGLAAFAALLQAAAQPATNGAASAAKPEVYLYETTQAGDEDPRELERVRLQVTHLPDGVVSTYRAEQVDGWEEVTIRTRGDCSIVTAIKEEFNCQRAVSTHSRIWVQDGVAFVQRGRIGGSDRVRSVPLGSTELVPDAAILFRLRAFPFDTDQTIEFLIASFSQFFVRMKVRQTGVETVMVPAGSFECYRLEATFEFLVLRFKTAFWFSKSKPHFLVKYEGRRGLFFTPVYTTCLTGMEAPAVSNGQRPASGREPPECLSAPSR
jgi:hypothetical protein